MSVYRVASQYLGGEFNDLNGLGIHDAAHVLATRFQLNKAELRSAIFSLLEEDVQAIDGNTTAVVEGADAIDEVLVDFARNYP